jgi:hypothetical protein
MRDMKLLSVSVHLNYISLDRIHLLMVLNEMKLLQNILTEKLTSLTCYRF